MLHIIFTSSPSKHKPFCIESLEVSPFKTALLHEISLSSPLQRAIWCKIFTSFPFKGPFYIVLHPNSLFFLFSMGLTFFVGHSNAWQCMAYWTAFPTAPPSRSGRWARGRCFFLVERRCEGSRHLGNATAMAVDWKFGDSPHWYPLDFAGRWCSKHCSMTIWGSSVLLSGTMSDKSIGFSGSMGRPSKDVAIASTQTWPGGKSNLDDFPS